MKSVLFVCVENSNRSQMAEAFTRIHGRDRIQAASAGSRPGQAVNPKAVEAMAERGYDLGSHRPKSLAEVGPGPWDYVVTMGCGDACPYVPTRKRLDWALPDPKHMPPTGYREVRDLIEQHVLELLREIDGEETRSSTDR